MQDRQYYTPEIQISYDHREGMYVARMTTGKGIYTVKGADYQLVQNSLAREVDAEMKSIFRSLEIELEGKVPGHSKKSSRSVSGGSGKSSFFSRSIGASSEIGMALLDDILSLFTLGKGIGKKMAVMFMGIKIVGRSKGELKKKIIRERNRRLQLIMNHMRTHKKEAELAKERQEKIRSTVARIRHKKHVATALGNKTWSQRVRPQGKRDVKKELDTMRERVKTNRQRARDLWMR